MTQSVYCGNNYYSLNSTTRLGTSYECMRKGVGVGLNLDLTNYEPRYRPIVPNTTFCGLGRSPPGRKKGSAGDCFRKGVGVGIKKAFEKTREQFDDSTSTTSNDVIESFNGDFYGARILKNSSFHKMRVFLYQYWPVLLAVFLMGLSLFLDASILAILAVGILSLGMGVVVQNVTNVIV